MAWSGRAGSSGVTPSTSSSPSTVGTSVGARVITSITAAGPKVCSAARLTSITWPSGSTTTTLSSMLSITAVIRSCWSHSAAVAVADNSLVSLARQAGSFLARADGPQRGVVRDQLVS